MSRDAADQPGSLRRQSDPIRHRTTGTEVDRPGLPVGRQDAGSLAEPPPQPSQCGAGRLLVALRAADGDAGGPVVTNLDVADLSAAALEL